MHDAYDDLAEDTKQKIEGLKAVHVCQCRFNFPHLCRSKIPQLAGCGDQPAV
jgi:hypothetical protein